MGIEFEKLSDVPRVEEFPENGANILIEHENIIKKCPADGIGGGGAGIPVLKIILDESVGEKIELEDGRTADQFVASFEKNGLCAALLMHLPGEEESGIVSEQCELIELHMISKVPATAPSEYSSIIGGVMYVYGDLCLTNIDMENMTLMDHYDWKISG